MPRIPSIIDVVVVGIAVTVFTFGLVMAVRDMYPMVTPASSLPDVSTTMSTTSADISPSKVSESDRLPELATTTVYHNASYGYEITIPSNYTVGPQDDYARDERVWVEDPANEDVVLWIDASGIVESCAHPNQDYRETCIARTGLNLPFESYVRRIWDENRLDANTPHSRESHKTVGPLSKVQIGLNRAYQFTVNVTFNGLNERYVLGLEPMLYTFMATGTRRVTTYCLATDLRCDIILQSFRFVSDPFEE